MKHSILLASLIAVSALAACGKKEAAPAPAPAGSPAPQPAPAPAPAGRLPSAPAPAPPRLSGSMTPEQVAAANRPLIDARAAAIRNGKTEEAAKILAQINENRAKIGGPAT